MKNFWRKTKHSLSIVVGALIIITFFTDGSAKDVLGADWGNGGGGEAMGRIFVLLIGVILIYYGFKKPKQT